MSHYLERNAPFRLYFNSSIRTTAQMLKSDKTFDFSKDSTVSSGSNILKSMVHSPTKTSLQWELHYL